MYRLVLSHLRFHSVQPVNESLESVCKLAGEQQGLLEFVLSAGGHISLHHYTSGWWVKIQQQMWEDVSSPFYWLATNSVPFIPQFTQHVVQLLVIILKGGLVFQGPPCSRRGVIYWVFAAQSLLELLSMRNIVRKESIVQPIKSCYCISKMNKLMRVKFSGCNSLSSDAQCYSEPSQRIFFLLLLACQIIS